MIKFEFKFNEIIESVIRRLQYLSGKRAQDKETYLRNVACEADTPLLFNIAEETLTEISMALGIYSGGFKVEADSLFFLVKCPEEHREEIATLLRATIRDGIIRRWFELTGFDAAGQTGDNFTASLDVFRGRLHSFVSLPLRKPLPFG